MPQCKSDHQTSYGPVVQIRPVLEGSLGRYWHLDLSRRSHVARSHWHSLLRSFMYLHLFPKYSYAILDPSPSKKKLREAHHAGTPNTTGVWLWRLSTLSGVVAGDAVNIGRDTAPRRFVSASVGMPPLQRCLIVHATYNHHPPNSTRDCDHIG